MRLVTTLATRPLASDRTGWHLLDDALDVSSDDAPGRDWLDGFRPTRNRKIEGFRISPGAHKSRGQTAGADRLPAWEPGDAPGSLPAM
jgi:hypothetical protein